MGNPLFNRFGGINNANPNRNYNNNNIFH